MPVPAVSTAFPDVLDSRFAKMYNDRYKQLPDKIDKFYDKVSGASAPTKDTYRTSQIGTFGDIPEFSGTVTYDDVNQGYDVIITPKEYASGFQIERKLYDDDNYGIMDAKPKGLATSYQRTRQKHAATAFNGAFSVDTTWLNNTENVALCSNSHTTTASGVSTATGFDNLSTAAMSATAVTAMRILMVNFRGDRAERISVMPSMLLYPPDLYDRAFEIVKSMGIPDSANNNANVHEGAYELVEWNYMTDVNNWFMIDSTMLKDALKCVDRVGYEFAMVEDFDTLIGKWRVYCRYGLGHNDWRWILGAQVA